MSNSGTRGGNRAERLKERLELARRGRRAGTDLVVLAKEIAREKIKWLIGAGLAALGYLAVWLTGFGAFGWASIASGLLAIGCLAAAIRLILKEFEVRNRIAEFRNTGLFRPASHEALREVVEIDRQWLPEQDIIDAETFGKWTRKNPTAIITHHDANDRVLGYFSILALEPETLKQFKNGQVSELEFTGDDILPEHSKDKVDMYHAEAVYFFSIAYRDATTAGFDFGRAWLIFEAKAFLEELVVKGKLKRIYATFAPDVRRSRHDQIRLAEKAGFQLVDCHDGRCYADGRADGHDLYFKDITCPRDLDLMFGRLAFGAENPYLS